MIGLRMGQVKRGIVSPESMGQMERDIRTLLRGWSRQAGVGGLVPGMDVRLNFVVSSSGFDIGDPLFSIRRDLQEGPI